MSIRCTAPTVAWSVFSTFSGWQPASRSIPANNAQLRRERVFMGTPSGGGGSFGDWAGPAGDDARDAVGVAGLHVESAPDDRAGQRLDVQHHLAVLEQADGARRLTDGDGDGLGALADSGGGGVTGAQPL